MGLFKSIKNAVKKTIRVATGGLVGGNSIFSQATEAVVPAPELGTVDNADITGTTEAESEKQQLTKGKKRGKKSLKVNMTGVGGAGRNIV